MRGSARPEPVATAALMREQQPMSSSNATLSRATVHHASAPRIPAVIAGVPPWTLGVPDLRGMTDPTDTRAAAHALHRAPTLNNANATP